MKTRTLNFSVDFEGATNFVRDLWAEGSFNKCYDLIESLGVTDDYKNDLIRGKIKIVEHPENPNWGMPVKDNWQPNLNHCHKGVYPDPDDLDEYLEQLAHEQTIEQNDRVELLRQMIQRWNNYTGAYDNSDKLELEDLRWAFTYRFDEKTFNILGLEKSQVLNNPYYKIDLPEMKLAHKPMINESKLDRTIANLLETPDDKPTTCFTTHGMIDPKGNFYACKYMQHQALCEQLGFYNTDRPIELGWVLISTSLFTNEPVFLYEKINQTQLDILMDWATETDNFDALNDLINELDD